MAHSVALNGQLLATDLFGKLCKSIGISVGILPIDRPRVWHVCRPAITLKRGDSCVCIALSGNDKDGRSLHEREANTCEIVKIWTWHKGDSGAVCGLEQFREFGDPLTLVHKRSVFHLFWVAARESGEVTKSTSSAIEGSSEDLITVKIAASISPAI